MVAKLTPPYGVSGIWKLKSPYVANPAKHNVCAAIHSFSDLLLLNVDIHQLYYAPHELEESVYEGDLAINASIVTLLSDDGERIFVPDTYILEYPDMSIGDYRRFILSCDLGTLPKDAGLEHIRTAVESAVENKLGRRPNVLINIGAIKYEGLTPAEQSRAEANRVAAVSDSKTEYGQLYELTKRIGDLEGFIVVLRKQLADKDRGELELVELKKTHESVLQRNSELEETNSELNTRVSTLSNEKNELSTLVDKYRKMILDLGGNPDQ